MERIRTVLSLLEDEEKDLLMRLEKIRAAKMSLTQESSDVKRIEIIQKPLLKLTRNAITKEKLARLLQNNVVKMEYVKLNGVLRTFEKITLDSNLFTYEAKGTKSRKENKNTITVYDLVDKQFKTLIISEIISVIILPF